MKEPTRNSLIAFGHYNWKKRRMTLTVYETDTKNLIFEQSIPGGDTGIAHFLAAAEAFKILDDSIETEKEYQLIYLNDWDALREVRAAYCASGLFTDDMLNFDQIDELIDISIDTFEKTGLKGLKEKTAMWDKHILGELNDYLK